MHYFTIFQIAQSAVGCSGKREIPYKCFIRAIARGKADIFEWLFKQNNHSLLSHSNQINLLFHSAWNHKVFKVAKMMIEVGADVNSFGDAKDTLLKSSPLNYAIQSRNIEAEHFFW